MISVQSSLPSKTMGPKRSPPFTQEETNLLLRLVEANREILVGKIDAITAIKRKQCWQEIEKHFNSVMPIPRPITVLKKKYENIRTKEKARYAQHLQRIIAATPIEQMESSHKRRHASESMSDVGVNNAEPQPIQKRRKTISVAVGNKPSPNCVSAQSEKQMSVQLDRIEYMNKPTSHSHINQNTPATEDSIKVESSFDASEELLVQSGDERWTAFPSELVNVVNSEPLSLRSSIHYSDDLTEAAYPAVRPNERQDCAQYLKKESEERIKLMRERHALEMSLLKEESQAKMKRMDMETELFLKNTLEEHQLKKNILELQRKRLLNHF